LAGGPYALNRSERQPKAFGLVDLDYGVCARKGVENDCIPTPRTAAKERKLRTEAIKKPLNVSEAN
jgi:hypothetical protein